MFIEHIFKKGVPDRKLREVLLKGIEEDFLAIEYSTDFELKELARRISAIAKACQINPAYSILLEEDKLVPYLEDTFGKKNRDLIDSFMVVVNLNRQNYSKLYEDLVKLTDVEVILENKKQDPLNILISNNISLSDIEKYYPELTKTEEFKEDLDKYKKMQEELLRDIYREMLEEIQLKSSAPSM